MAGIYAVGVLSTLIYTRLMVRVSQGSLKAIRDDMFNHMQSLPIRYFDTHTHGDVMSHYTNDTDTPVSYTHQMCIRDRVSALPHAERVESSLK